MRDFTDTIHCTSGVHCRLCRQLDAGRDWRGAWARWYRLPEGGVDFACPRGLPWGFEGHAPKVQSLRERNEAVCNACDEKPTCHIWRGLSPCKRAKALRGDPAYPCPQGKFQKPE